MSWAITKAILLVAGLFVAWVTVDLLWRRVFGVGDEDTERRGGCGSGCMCTRRMRPAGQCERREVDGAVPDAPGGLQEAG